MQNKSEVIKKRAYEIFLSKGYKMVESKFLLAQPFISGLLKCITASKELYMFFKESISNIDCENELIKASLKENNVFRLPESKRVMIALVTYLLSQFDSNEIDLMEFVAYYYNSDTNIGYQVFCKEVIIPYIKAVGDLFLSDNTAEQEEAKEEVKDINAVVFEQADEIIKDIITQIESDNSLNDIERYEMITMTEGMMIALSNLDRKVIVALWIGMKYILGKNRKISKLLKELEKLLSNYQII